MTLKHPPHLAIGFCGASGSGKSAVARLVRERFLLPRETVPCEIRKFAAPIREMLRIVGVEKGDQSGEVGHEAYRDAAQHIGQWFRAEVSEEFWVNIQADALAGLSRPTVVLFDDVRHHNEAATCDWVVRLVTARAGRLTPEQMLHPSERNWERIAADAAFTNDTPDDAGRIADAVAVKIIQLWKGKQ